MSLKSTNVLVTGANGFAGSNLCRLLLEKNANVRAFVRRGGSTANLVGIEDRIDVRLGDVTDLTTLLKATKDIDVVYHLAAVVPVVEARNVPHNTFEVNVVGTFNTAWAAKENGVRKMLHASTCHVYGNQPLRELPLRETVKPNPHDIYATSKYASEIVLQPLINEGFEIVISRAFNHFGPYQEGDFIISKIISQSLKKQNPVLGNPQPTRDFMYVDDVLNGYLLAVEKGRSGEIYHFCSGKEVSMSELCNEILTIGKKEFGMDEQVAPIWSSKRSMDIDRSYGDNSKARKELGWEQRVSLEDGIRKTFEWWNSRQLN